MSTNVIPGPGPSGAGQPQRVQGMIPQEVVIFQAWWGVHAHEYTSADFNVRVGHGVDPGPEIDMATRQAQIANSKYRLDALLWQGDLPTIVEVKYRAGLSALGQLLGYRALWAEDHPEELSPKVVLLCFMTNEDTIFAARMLGVEVVLQQADFSNITLQSGT